MHRLGNEREDIASRAPEVDSNALAPEHYPIAEGLHLCNDEAGLEITPHKNESIPAEQPSPTYNRKVSKWKIVIISVVLSQAVLAIALGIGLGVGLKHGAPISNSSIPVQSSKPTFAPTLKSAILNDTSLAAITTSDGLKHMFFQDLNGSLRHTSYNQSIGSWSTPAQYIETNPVARNLTPLAVVGIGSGINVFYASIENALANVVFNSMDTDLLDFQLNGSFPIAPNSRTLTIAQTKHTLSMSGPVTTIAEIILIYEAPNSNITTLYGSLNYDGPTGSPDPIWGWQNVSDAVYSAIRNRSDTWLSPPIATRTMTEMTSVQDPQSLSTHVCIAYFNTNSLSDGSANPVYLATFDDWSGPVPDADQIAIGLNVYFSNDYSPNNATAAIRESDLISYFSVTSNSLNGGSPGANGFNPWAAAWVQDQNFLLGSFPQSTLSTPYPFSRLAWLNDSITGVIHVYHQLSDSVLCEDIFTPKQGWNSTNITIGTLTQ